MMVLAELKSKKSPTWKPPQDHSLRRMKQKLVELIRLEDPSQLREPEPDMSLEDELRSSEATVDKLAQVRTPLPLHFAVCSNFVFSS
jgi:hypothetical protein